MPRIYDITTMHMIILLHTLLVYLATFADLPGASFGDYTLDMVLNYK